MKLKINLSELTDSLLKGMFRFPLAFVCAFAAMVYSNLMLDLDGEEIKAHIPLMLCLGLGISLFSGLGLLGFKKPPLQSILIQMAGIPILVLCYFLIDSEADEIQAARTALLGVLFHLFVSIAVSRKNQSQELFWQANQALLLRLLNTAFYSIILYGGLALAMLAVDLLFDIDFDKSYMRLYLFIVFVFNTWFFLSGLKEEEEVHFPKGLRVFTQFVLIPLVLIYFLILYAYAGKIIIAWSWPIGWVSNLILGFSIAGILAYLLVFPISDKLENRMMRLTGRSIFIALVPLVVMMGLAVLRRINDYGITEERYYLSNLTVWLAFISVYYGFLRSRNIKLIPLSLAIIALINIAGPLSGVSVSKRNQLARLEKALEDNGLMENGMWKSIPSKQLSSEEYKRVEGPLRYLISRHHFTALNAILPEIAQLGEDDNHSGTYSRTNFVLGIMLADQVDVETSEWRSYSFEREGKGFKPPVGDFDAFFHIQGNYRRGRKELTYAGMEFQFRQEGRDFIIQINQKEMRLDLVSTVLERLNLSERQLMEYGNKLSEEQALIRLENEHYDVHVLLDDFNLNTESDSLVITNMEYFTWVKKKN